MRSANSGDGEAGKPVVRLHLRSTLEDVNHRDQEAFCLAEPGWAGVGWGCRDDTPSGITWSDYQTWHGQVNESVQRLYELPIGALVWTRRRDGSYWLGELTGPWEYRGDQRARELDLSNLRPCRWWNVGTEDAVPGKIVGNFRAQKTVNPVTDPIAVRYTHRLHAQLSAGGGMEPVAPKEVIASLLGAEALEDLVAVYLQDRYDLVLVSRGRCTPGYEYVLRHRSTGRRAVASVKSGNSAVDLDLLPDSEEVDAYVYAVSGRFTGRQRANVRRITTEELAAFLQERRPILPEQVARWLQ